MLQNHREYNDKNSYTKSLKNARNTIPEVKKLLKMAELYKMFSDLTRIRILWALESGELCVSDLASLLDMSSSAISHQLKALRYSNLVISRREGKHIYYILADKHIKDILLQGFGHINE